MSSESAIKRGTFKSRPLKSCVPVRAAHFRFILNFYSGVNYSTQFMKLKYCAFLFCILLLSCRYDKAPCPVPSDCTDNVSIVQGVSGSCVYRYGDWMPGPEKCGQWSTSERRILFFTPTVDSQTVTSGVSWFTAINTTLVAETTCDANGCYQLALPAGRYSIFIREEGKYYANSRAGDGTIGEVTVDSASVTRRNLILDYNAAY